MNKTSKIIFFSVAIIVIVALIVSMNGNEPKTNVNTNNNSVVAPVSNNSAVSNNVPSGISADDLAKHNSKEDCWVEYKGKAYDLTDWLTKHPGGVSAIAKYCGTDKFEEAFVKKHGTSKASFFLQVAKLMGDFDLKGNLA